MEGAAWGRSPRARKPKKQASFGNGRIFMSDEFGEFEVNTHTSSLLSPNSESPLSASMLPPPPPPRFSPVLTLLQLVREAEPRMTEEEMLGLALAVRSRRGSVADVSATELVKLIRLESRKRGADNILRAFSKFTITETSALEGNECAICLEALSKLKVQMLECGHAFHLKCITSWYKEKRECPCCRRHVHIWQDFPPLA